jgi:hypothetical protein
VASLLLEMLQWAELKRPPKGGVGLPALALQLRVGKTVLRGAGSQEEVVQQVGPGA